MEISNQKCLSNLSLFIGMDKGVLWEIDCISFKIQYSKVIEVSTVHWGSWNETVNILIGIMKKEGTPLEVVRKNVCPFRKITIHNLKLKKSEKIIIMIWLKWGLKKSRRILNRVPYRKAHTKWWFVSSRSLICISCFYFSHPVFQHELFCFS